MTAYRVYDVFTDTPFGGNQLAVIPEAAGLPEDHLQAIAREFNYSETVFLYPPDNPAHTAKVRIFTPTMEIPFAGHPTIGTSICLSDLGHGTAMTLELGVGPIDCTVTEGLASFTTTAPLDRMAIVDATTVANAIGLAVDQIVMRTHAPTQASLGLPFVIAELHNRAALAACRPVIDGFRAGATQYPAGLDFAVFAYVRDGNAVDARMFAPLDNIPEDPATGSACATLAALLHQTLNTPQTLNIRQGEDMGRLSLIVATTTGTTPNVTIRGQAVLTMEGRLAY